MHEAAFELIEIPHVSYSGKNSADIRLVVDALDLCYTKSHVDIFVVVSGDSDFSPLVSKLRENAKQVIGLGVKNASSDLLVDNCDEFIYYDDLVRDKRGTAAKTDGGRNERSRSKRRENSKPAGKKQPRRELDRPAEPKKTELGATEPKKTELGGGELKKGEVAAGELKKTETLAEQAAGDATVGEPGNGTPSTHTHADEVGSKEEALELVLDTVEALFREREDNLWGSMVKQTLKRKRPNFSETFYGYRTFNQLLEDAQKQGLLDIQKDEKSGGYLIISFGPQA
jgi:hypothetical protein